MTETITSETLWIETYTGIKFYPLRPRVSDIRPEDIGHALSMICRFNGHCHQFYSVAEHCVRVAALLPPRLQLGGLLHDAAEAYIADLSRPVKHQLAGVADIEHAILDVILARFGAPYDRDLVKWADNVMLATEARDLMASTDGWYLPEPALPGRIDPWPQPVAKRAWLDIFHGVSEVPEA
ncbi:MAG: phosphohydrolase [Deltaproteobacteria bacterium]|nr:phosphohydrolase [Deltaproteobacteria bacterium]